MKNLTANQIILLFIFYTGQEITNANEGTFSSDLLILLQRELIYFPKCESFEITNYGKNYCERLINETTKP